MHIFEHVAVDDFDDVGVIESLEVFDFAEDHVDIGGTGWVIKKVTYFLDFYDLDCCQFFSDDVLGQHYFSEPAFSQGLDYLVFSKIRLKVKILSPTDINSFFILDEGNVIILILDAVNGKEANVFVLGFPGLFAMANDLLFIQWSFEKVFEETVGRAVLDEVNFQLLGGWGFPLSLVVDFEHTEE